MADPIKSYYDDIAKKYDDDRFGNTYGDFIHRQEATILEQFLPAGPTVDLACGTGRFMQFCQAGVDLSPEMLAVAKEKFSNRSFYESSVFDWQPEQKFRAAICFHLLMHLQPADLSRLLDKVYDWLEPGGTFILDLQGRERKFSAGGSDNQWHGTNAYTHQEVLQAIRPKWQLVASRGILFLPIHRFPPAVRDKMLGIDTLLNRTWGQKYSSYRVYVLRKR